MDLAHSIVIMAANEPVYPQLRQRGERDPVHRVGANEPCPSVHPKGQVPQRQGDVAGVRQGDAADVTERAMSDFLRIKAAYESGEWECTSTSDAGLTGASGSGTTGRIGGDNGRELWWATRNEAVAHLAQRDGWVRWPDDPGQALCRPRLPQHHRGHVLRRA
jgi:hypothetical protein